MVRSTFAKEDIWTLALRASAKDIFGKGLYARANSHSLWSHWHSSWEPSWPVVARSLLGNNCRQGRDPRALDPPQVKTLLALIFSSLGKSESWHREGVRKSGQASSSNRLNKGSNTRVPLQPFGLLSFVTLGKKSGWKFCTHGFALQNLSSFVTLDTVQWDGVDGIG